MTDPVRRLKLYREDPAPVPLRAREHMPVCGWCMWSRDALNYRLHVCVHPANNPAEARGGIEFNTQKFNRDASCRLYRPTTRTRLLQWLRLWPFVERTREGEES